MNNLNIPKYRAKKIGSDEYVIGNYIKVHNKFYIYEDGTSDIYLEDEECFDDGSIDGEIRIIDLIFESDSTTLSIHFPDMTDSQGNKIFASLSEDGKGGDKMKCDEYYGIAKYLDSEFVVEYENVLDNINNQNFEVIGIQD